MKDIVVIVGPTGVGKTKLSVELAKNLNAEIINADSMQVYKDLNIGTAKIKEDEKEGITHHLFDIKDVNEMYTIYDYQKDARNKIKEILNKGKKVIFVGGSGLYIKAALYDYKLNDEIKKNEYDNLSNEEIKARIEKVTTCNIHINNRKRLVRMLQKIDNGDIINEYTNNDKIYDFITIGLTTSRDNLYNIINTRVDKMFDDGLLNEVKNLYKQNIRSKAIMTGIGYKELYDYFDKKVTLDDAISNIKRNSRRYAKRQYTFFNNQMDVLWFNTNYENFNQTVCDVLEKIKNS